MEETSRRTGLLVGAVVAAAVATVVALVLVTLLLMDTHAEPGESSVGGNRSSSAAAIVGDGRVHLAPSMEELRLGARASG